MLRFVLVALLIAVLLLLLGCDSSHSPTEPSRDDLLDTLTVTVESQNYVYHMSPGDTVDVERQEAFHSWAVARLGVAPPRMEYFKYRDVAQMQELTRRSANGWADPGNFAVHSTFPWHNHETVHVYSALIGRPSDFFNEGLAVALSVNPVDGVMEPSYSGALSVHQWARDEGTHLLPLGQILTTADFRAEAEFIGYQTAGSFVAFLIEEYGMDPVLALFAGGGRDDSRDRIEGAFQSAFGIPLTQAEERWHDWLGIAAP